MKCKLYECQEQTTGNYPFCSGTHYQVFQNRKAEMDDWFNADLFAKELLSYNETKLEGNKPYRANHTVEEAQLICQ